MTRSETGTPTSEKWVKIGPEMWRNSETGNVYDDDNPEGDMYVHAGNQSTLPNVYRDAPMGMAHRSDLYEPWMKGYWSTPDTSVAGFSPLDGNDTGGDLTAEQKERMNAVLSHEGGYDEETGGAVDPTSSANSGFDSEEWLAEDADAEQVERLTGDGGPFTEDGDLKDGRTAETSGGGLVEPTDDSDSSASSRSGGGDGGTVPDSGVFFNNQAVMAGAAVAIGLAVRRWV